jgi:uncharacterized cofD-like protein
MTTVTKIKPSTPTKIRRRRRVRVIHGLKWLTPGLRVKRWMLLIPIGLFPVLLGVVILMQQQAIGLFDLLSNLLGRATGLRLDEPNVYIPIGGILILLGLTVVLAASIGVVRNIVSVVSPEQELYDLPDVIQKKRTLSQGPRIVVIGGGTGLSTLLRGLKRHTANLTAVVTMTDDGGSSGLLQRQMAGGMLPPGDIRNCLVALADAEPLMQELFQYRFETKDDQDGLSGHSFGNLLIAAMANITGDFEQAIEKTSSILAIRGRVLPSTVESVLLVGEMADGREVTGETSIAHDPSAISNIKLCPEAPKPLPVVIEAISTADVIVMGPGSVFTSVIPNLLVREIAEAVAASRAPKVYVCNVMTQPGETDGYAASDHVKAIQDHVLKHHLPEGERVIDYVLMNTARPSDEELLARYKKTGSQFVEPDAAEITALGYKPISGNFISESAVVRHDPEKIAKAILGVWSERYTFGKQKKRP